MTSINLTIHNKAWLLPQLLQNMWLNATGTYEIVFVLDNCTDESERIVSKFCRDHKEVKTTIIVSGFDLYETKANNLAAKASTGDHIIIVQDDMLIKEHGWNERLIEPFKKFNDVFAVTARTAHNWKLNPDSKDLHASTQRNDGWSDILIATDQADRHNTARNEFAIRDSVNRGPLAIHSSVLHVMGYFDEAFYPLDSDEHDFCYRVKQKTSKVCGCYWIDWYSAPEWGGTRDAQGNTKPWMFAANQKNAKLLYQRHSETMKQPRIETRTI